LVVVVFRKNKAYNMPILSERENEQQTERERKKETPELLKKKKMLNLAVFFFSIRSYNELNRTK
jgi:hypothetical protein